MITKKERESVNDKATLNGISISLNDFTYYALCDIYGKEYAYKFVFDKYATEEEINAYNESSVAAFIRNEIDYIISKKTDFSFESNRQGMIKDLDILIRTRDDITDPKELSTITGKIFDARKALNDKFGANEKIRESKVIVTKRKDFICPHTKHECYQFNPENWETFDLKDAVMKKYNLIENKEDE